MIMKIFTPKPYLMSILVALIVGCLRAPAMAATPKSPNVSADGHFFIISSVDLRKHVLFLRHPTDVTTVMDVGPNTEFLDENGKKIQFNDLRAGNTVYVTFHAGPKGTPVATRVRLGPMTLAVLHQRYLHFK
jgi:hypothetical protein